ncbi:hypothetical protein WJX81_005518 [Elliptochloris bilobata]|uniref:U3 small nucleolar RNA-associated protein 11 n=1 Tax=Elliptochloris bilobata TaxID=381761 RepID=A0AAW1SJP8_9CHLO
MSSLRNAVKRKTHKERSQPAARRQYGLLEKKKDYKERADDFHRKEDALRRLRRKAEERNPDEFYFAMEKARTREGVHAKSSVEANKYSQEELRLMKTQDANYVTLKAQAEAKKVERLRGALHFIGAPVQARHTVFVDSEAEAAAFAPEAFFDTPTELLGRTFNRPRRAQLEDAAAVSGMPTGDGGAVPAARLERRRAASYKELLQRQQRQAKLGGLAMRMTLQKQLMGKGTKRKLKPHEQEGSAPNLFTSVLKGLAVAAIAVGLVLGAASPALAARSGGRVGGSSFSSATSYGGGASSFGGSSRSYGGSSLGSGYSGSRSAPALSGGSSINFGWGMVPFGGYGYGGFGGYGYGAPVVASGGGVGFGEILVLGVLAVIAFQVISSLTNAGSESFGGEKVAVAKLQVAMLGSARSLQRQLDCLADRANTSTPAGLHFVLQEAVLALLRNPEYAVYGSSKVRKENGLDSGEDAFNEVSLQERGKFKEETLVNVGGRSRSNRMSRGGGDGMQELIVVTLLVAVQGKLQLPRITSREELVTALNRLGAVREDQLMAMEVLWTPQDESDSYTRDELFLDYPDLNTL